MFFYHHDLTWVVTNNLAPSHFCLGVLYRRAQIGKFGVTNESRNYSRLNELCINMFNQFFESAFRVIFGEMLCVIEMFTKMLMHQAIKMRGRKNEQVVEFILSSTFV